MKALAIFLLLLISMFTAFAQQAQRTKILSSDKRIKVMLPHDSANAHVFNNEFMIYWIDIPGSGGYQLVIQNMFGEVLHKIKATQSPISFDMNYPQFKKDTLLYITVSSQANPKITSSKHAVKRMTLTQRKRIEKAKEELELGDKALDEFILAGFYEEHLLFTDAINAYVRSVDRGGDTPIYREGFDIFLTRHGFSRK